MRKNKKIQFKRLGLTELPDSSNSVEDLYATFDMDGRIVFVNIDKEGRILLPEDAKGDFKRINGQKYVLLSEHRQTHNKYCKEFNREK